jgi:hypothetical protein
MARTVPAPVIATRTIVDESRTTQLQESLETVMARLSSLEIAYQTLLSQQGALMAQEPSS